MACFVAAVDEETTILSTTATSTMTTIPTTFTTLPTATTSTPSVNRDTTFTGTPAGRINVSSSGHTLTAGSNLVSYLSPPTGILIDPRIRQFYFAGHFSISGVSVGGLATVVIQYPCEPNVNAVVKFSADGSLHIVGYDDDTGIGAQFLAPLHHDEFACRVKLTIQDGGDGDDDLAEDGVVKDPFFLAYSVDSGTGASMIAQALIPTIIFAGVGIGALIGWMFARSRMSGSYSPVAAQ
jgi:hypothetical protein